MSPDTPVHTGLALTCVVLIEAVTQLEHFETHAVLLADLLSFIRSMSIRKCLALGYTNPCSTTERICGVICIQIQLPLPKHAE